MKRNSALAFARSITLATALGTAFGNSGAWASDLMQTYKDALAYDAPYASARAALDAGREKLPLGRAGLLPSVSLSAGSVWNHQDMSTRSQPPADYVLRYNNNFYSVQLSQPLFRWQNWVQYKEAQLAVAVAEAQFTGAGQDLVLRVAQAYFDVLLAQNSLETAQAQKKAISEQLAQAKRNFEVGTSTIVDSHEAQARFDLTTAQEIAAGSDLELKRQVLRQLTGKAPDTLKTLRPGVQIASPQPADMDKWVQSAEQSNVSVQAQQLNFEIATREVEKNHANHLPSVDLVASYGKSSFSSASNPLMPVGSDTTASTLGVQLSMPLFAGGALFSRDREAVALKEKAQQDLENVRRNAALSARQAYLGVSSGLAQVKALEAGLTSSISALDSNKLGYEVGVRINIDVLNAQQQVYATRRDLSKARYDTIMAELKLKAAAGSLTEADLQQVNGLLQ
jgi:outer membrane protein